MSKYTTELRFYCESVTGLESDDYNTVIDAAIPHLFSFPFPFYTDDAQKLLDFKRAIVKHFYTREIGDETIGLFKLRLDDKLNEIMPYYNQMFKMVEKEYDPLFTHELDVVNDGESKTNTAGNIRNAYKTNAATAGELSTNESIKHEGRKIDTPQSSLTNFRNGTYMSGATIDDNTDEKKSNEYQNTKTETTSDSDTLNNQVSVQHSTHKERGRVGYSAGELLKSYYESLRNVYAMIFEELDPLFMMLW